ncbi:MAG: HutD family protein [Devosia sp.]|nr:HutD family protein [Devosia sp.]
MRILRRADHVAVPWKNGGGITREIALAPDPAGTSDFLWRVSIASVRAPGPFSRFDGIERTIAVLFGNGIRLCHANGEEIMLTTTSPPYRFDGASPIFADVVAGETTDLNAMSRRGAYTHAMRRLSIAEPTDFHCTADTTLFVAAAPLLLEVDTRSYRLSTLDAALDLTRGTRVCLSAEPCAEVFILEFSNTLSGPGL